MKIITVPLHIGDFLGGVMHMDGTEIGAYTMLIVAHYQAGEIGLKDDDKSLAKTARLTLKQWQRVRETVLEKFYLEGGFWKNSKVIEVISQIELTSSNQRAKALKRHNSPLPGHCQPKTLNLKPKESKNPPLPPEGVEIPEWLPEGVWRNFLNHRGKKFKPEAQRLALGKLERWKQQGHDPTEIINNSIMNGWKGLFEPKEKSNENASRKPTKSAETSAALAAKANELIARYGGEDPPASSPDRPMLQDIRPVQQGPGGCSNPP
jgi:uncharacterized protein YdaU (DUF1376 family)